MPRPAAVAALCLLALAATGGVVLLVSGGGRDRGARGLGSPPSVGGSAAQPAAHAGSPSGGASVRPPAPAGATAASTAPTTTTPAASATAPGPALKSVEVTVGEDGFAVLAQRLRLRPEQTERIKAIYLLEAQEMKRRIEQYRGDAAGASGGADGIARLLEEGRARIKAGVTDVLDPDQRPLLEALEAEEAAKEAAKAKAPGGG